MYTAEVGGRVWCLGAAGASHYPISLPAGMLAGKFGRFIGRLYHQTAKRWQGAALRMYYFAEIE